MDGAEGYGMVPAASYTGGGECYIIMVATDEALRGCVRLRLPCYNATGEVDGKYLSGYTYGTWAKVLMTQLVLRVLPPDLDLHLSDHDVVRMLGRNEGTVRMCT